MPIANFNNALLDDYLAIEDVAAPEQQRCVASFEDAARTDDLRAHVHAIVCRADEMERLRVHGQTDSAIDHGNGLVVVAANDQTVIDRERAATSIDDGRVGF